MILSSFRPAFRFALASALAGLMASAALAAPPPKAKPAKPQATSIAPPEAPKTVKSGKAEAGQLSVKEVGMGGLVVEFGRTRLDDVMKSAGGAISAKVDASSHWLCYTVETGRRMWLSSDAPANGAVTAVTLLAQPGISGEPACPGLSPRLQPGADLGGVSLGQRRGDVETQLGHASAGEWTRYESCSTAAGVTPAAARRCTALTLRYVNNRVMQITASQTLG